MQVPHMTSVKFMSSLLPVRDSVFAGQHDRGGHPVERVPQEADAAIRLLPAYQTGRRTLVHPPTAGVVRQSREYSFDYSTDNRQYRQYQHIRVQQTGREAQKGTL